MKPPSLADYMQLPASGASLGYSLHNPTQPTYEVKHQREEHLLMVMLKAQGLSYREIAQKTGFSAIAVGNVLKQPWARQQLLFELKQAGRDALNEMIEEEASESLLTLVEIRDNKDCKAADRRAAAEYLINRKLGTPKAQIEHSGHVKLEELSDEELIKRLPAEERAQLEKQQSEGRVVLFNEVPHVEAKN
jgi:hypothetical protein